MSLNGKEHLKVRHQLAKFGGHKHYADGDIIVLVCHFISQNHTKYFMVSHNPVKIGGDRHCGRGYV